MEVFVKGMNFLVNDLEFDCKMEVLIGKKLCCWVKCDYKGWKDGEFLFVEG